MARSGLRIGGRIRRPLEAGRGVPGLSYKYNPSLIRHEGGTLIAYRESPGGRSWASRLFLADFEEGAATEARRIEVDAPQGLNDGVSDPRLIHHQGKIWLSYSYDCGRFRTSNVALCELDPSGRTRNGRVFPRLNDGPQEKNWQFFEYEGRLLIVYSIAPEHVVLDLDLNELHRGPGVRWPGGSRKGFHWPAGKPRGGTPPVRIDDWFISFFHATTDEGGSFTDRYYVVGVYAFEAKPPFRIVRQSLSPLLAPNLNDRPPGSIRPNVVFPCGAIRRDDSTWDVSYGYYDDHARILQWGPDLFAKPENPLRQGVKVAWM